MRDEEDCLAPQSSLDALVEEVVAHMRVDRRQRIVQQIHLCVTVQSACERDAGLLAA